MTAYRAELSIGFTFSSLAQLRVPPSPPSSTVVRSEPIRRCIHSGEWKRRVSQTPQGLLSKPLFCICTDGSRATERRFQYGTSSLPVEAACLRHLLPSSDHRARRNSLSLVGYIYIGCALYFARSTGFFTFPRSRTLSTGVPEQHFPEQFSRENRVYSQKKVRSLVRSLATVRLPRESRPPPLETPFSLETPTLKF